MNRRAIAVLVCLSALVVAGAWWWSARSPRWNVVLITLDTTRADHLGCYGCSSDMTPNIDRLASESAVFERAYTVVPITLPAHATMLTGKLPPEHSLRINGVSRLADSVPTLAEILQQQEYQTGAFVSSLVLDARFGLARGFDNYNDRLANGPDGPRAERSAAETVAAAMAWLNRLAPEPFFCWVHFYDPHEPYDEHRELFEDQFAGRPYDAEIAYMDRHIGRLLDSLQRTGVEDRTLILIAGDHGEGLGDHDEATHGYLAYNATMHVPLLIRQPGPEHRGLRVAAPVSLVDIFPTILDSLQIDRTSASTGRSLLPYWRHSSLASRACYGETEAPLMEGGWCPLRTWTTDRWKYIQSTKPELYDLQADPDENNNVVDQHPAEVAALSQELTDLESQLILNRGANAVLSEQEQRALASLGYTGGTEVADRERDTPRRDIKETLKYAEQVHQCMHLIDRNEFDKAQQILTEVIEALPDYSKAWGTLGVCFARQEDYPAAERNFREAIDLDSNQNFARIGLGRAQGQRAL
ncbi:MAG: sulfatase-like hydrolase/transferase [Fuerstiella sp.]